MPRRLDLSFLESWMARRRVLAITAAFAVGGVAYALLAPRWYKSTLAVAPIKAQRSGLSGLLGGDLGGLAEGALGGSADVARVAAVLQSVSVSDAVIDKFSLKARYGEQYQETTRDALWRHCDVKALNKPGLVQLTCEDHEPKFVQEMLGYFASYGNEVFRRVNSTSASEEVRYLERRVTDLRQEAGAAADRMRTFQEKHRIIDLDAQAKAVVSNIAALNSQSIARELELNLGRRFAAPDEPSILQLESQLRVMDQKLRYLQEPSAAGTGTTGGGESARGLFPAALAVPQLRSEFESLFRDRKVSEVSLLMAMERLEAARANEARDTSTFQVLDPPTLPTRHSRPKRGLVVIFTTLVGLGIAIGFEWWRSYRPTPAG